MPIDDAVWKDVRTLIEQAKAVSADAAVAADEVLRLGEENPLSVEELGRLLGKVVEVLRAGAAARGDAGTVAALDERVRNLIDTIAAAREKLAAPTSVDVGETDSGYRNAILDNHNGIRKVPVLPHPWFHGKEIPMWSGYVKTADIALWEKNARLEIHLGQFEQTHGRRPKHDELLQIMLGQMPLPGITEDDQFKIVELARSIAINGVRKPPILDTDGKLLDGNRRVAACYLILNSDNDEFDPDEKRRAEYIYCWQLSEHADDDDRRRVVVSLNFESDCKEDWPKYVKARTVYEEWEAVLAREGRSPGPRRLADLKKEISRKFALGPDTGTVNLYLRMVDWASQFEDYHIQERRRDTFEVKHKADHYFEYFDELSKGAKPGGVAYSLTQNDAFRRVVFDLLFDGKFTNWRQIRELKYIADNEEAREEMLRARMEPDVDEAEGRVENAISIARTKQAETRSLGANTRIEGFVKWLEDLPIKAFRQEIRPENLKRLLDALRLVERQAAAVIMAK